MVALSVAAMLVSCANWLVLLRLVLFLMMRGVLVRFIDVMLGGRILSDFGVGVVLLVVSSMVCVVGEVLGLNGGVVLFDDWSVVMNGLMIVWFLVIWFF